MIHTLLKLRMAGGAVALGFLVMVIGGCATQDPPKKDRYENQGLRPVPGYLKDTIYERCNLENTEPSPVSAYGLVVNLPGTGGNQGIPRSVREYMLDELSRHGFGLATSDDRIRRLKPERILDDPNRATAVVKVTGYIPPGARERQVIDLTVEALPDSEVTSLARGTLYRTSLRLRGADPFNPRGAVNIYAIGEGEVFVNPLHAVDTPSESTAKASLRFGSVLGHAFCTEDRPLILLLRTPEYRIAGAIQERIRLAFPPDQEDSKQRAQARDNGVVDLYVPRNMSSDWEHFANVVMHLYFNGTSEFRAAKAKELAEEAQKPEITAENLSHISYAWEGLGKPAVQFVQKLYSHPRPEVAFYSARAGAYLGDRAALEMLQGIARRDGHAYQLTAVKAMAWLPQSPRVQRTLEELLDSKNNLIRLTAYRILAGFPEGQSRFATYRVGGFTVDMIPSEGPTLIYAWRVGQARLAVFGKNPALRLPIMFTALEQTFTISSAEEPGMIKIVYAGPDVPKTISAVSSPMIHDVIRHLGGGTPAGLRFSYADVVGILYKLAQKDLPATFVLQDAPKVRSVVDDAPPIPDLGTAGSGGTSSPPVPPSVTPPIGVAPSVGQTPTVGVSPEPATPRIGVRPDAPAVPDRPATQPATDRPVNVPSIGVRQ